MFFEDLESREMFSASIHGHALHAVHTSKAKVPANVLVASQDAPSSKNPRKPGKSPIDRSSLLGAPEIGKANKQLGAGTITLPGGFMISLDPTHLPSAADFAGLDVMTRLMGDLRGGSDLQRLLSLSGKSANKLTDPNAGGATDPTAKPDLNSFIDAFTADFQEDLKFARGDSISKIADGDTSDTSTNTTNSDSTKQDKKKPSLIDKIVAFFTSDDTKQKVDDAANYGADVVLERNGPPGPWKTLLEAPKFVETVTGDSKDLLNGFKAIFQSGDKDPRMPHGTGTELSDPNSDDVKLDPQTKKTLAQLWAFIGGPKSSLMPTGTSLISQPKRGDDGNTFVAPHGLNLKGSVPRKDNSTIINTLGDDGTGNDGAATTPVHRLTPGVKDPAPVGTDVGSTTTTPHPGGNTPSNPTGPVNNGGDNPTNPKP